MRKAALCMVAVILIAAVLVIGLSARPGNSQDPQDPQHSQDSQSTQDTRDSETQSTYDSLPPANFIPPVMMKIVGTVKEAGRVVCVLDVTAVYISSIGWIDIKESSRFKEGTKIKLADGSSWDFTPGEALSFKYVWRGEGADGPKAGDEVFLLFRNIFPDGPMFIEPGEMYFVTEEV